MAAMGYGRNGSHWKSTPVKIEIDFSLLGQPERDILRGMTTAGSPHAVELLPIRKRLKLARYDEAAASIPLHRWLRQQVDQWRTMGATQYRVLRPFFSGPEPFRDLGDGWEQ
ncbi:hypothetical protein CBI36_13230 [Acetobacter oryzifermentans]|nr:hypothetical protein CBI36_13230 [Acetobacter oryzifermentans]